MDEAVMRIVAQLRRSRKYRGLCDEVLAWAAADALRRSRREGEATKTAKRRLHQAYGSFLAGNGRRRALQCLEHAAEDPPRARGWLAQALRAHVSTAERDDPAALWAWIRDRIGPIRSILDLGCGLAPASLPWSGLDTDVSYIAHDLDVALCDALQAALGPRWPGLVVQAREIRSVPRWPASDVALLWKLVPTLERQQAGSTTALLDGLPVRHVVATFPTRSLSGQDHGMEDHYRALADRILGPGEDAVVGTEWVRVVTRP